jgi:acyl-coenzyme A thioesterase PaaI-like protein
MFGNRFIEVGVGSAVFEMPLSEWLCGPHGAISIGTLAIPADAALGCPVQSGLPPGTPLTTSELSLRVLAPARPGTAVIVRGRLLHARRSLALSEVSLIDGNGRTLAHGSSLCFILPSLSPPPEPPSALKPVEQANHDTPDPWARPPEGTILAQEVWDRMSGLEVLRARITDELPEPPITRLTGLRPTAAAEGEATFTLPATEWLCAPPRGRVQGG